MTNATDLMLVSKSEFELRAGEVVFGTKEMEELLYNKEVFVKYIDKMVNTYRSNIAMLRYKAEEIPAIYISINTLINLKTSIEETQQNWNTYMNNQDKSK
mgnify:CR=1 FL=1